MQNNSHDNIHQGCPIVTMTAKEILRYLQQGYDSAVQSAIENHVKECSQCQKVLARYKKAYDTAGQILSASLSNDHSKNANHLDAMTLAAFFDNGLSKHETQKVKDHLAQCVNCFYQYRQLEKGMISQASLNLKTPEYIKQSVKIEKSSFFKRFSESIDQFLQKMLDKMRRFFQQRWAFPALGFATGVILIVWIGSFWTDEPRTTVVLPPLSSVALDTNTHTMSGMPSDLAKDAVPSSVIEINMADGKAVTFQWQTDTSCEQYRVGLYDESGKPIQPEVTTEKNSYSISDKKLPANQIYVANVLGINKNGGTKLISRVRFRLVK